MSLEIDKKRVLTVLSNNINFRGQHPLDSATIAGQLQMKEEEIRQIVKILQEQGTVVCDLEGYYSLITAEGLHRLGHSPSSGAGGNPEK